MRPLKKNPKIDPRYTGRGQSTLKFESATPSKVRPTNINIPDAPNGQSTLKSIPSNAGPNTMITIDTPDAPKQRYDLRQHNREFDQWKHGYIWKRGCMWYRRPDGVDVRSYAGVSTINEFGELDPC